MSVGNVGVTTLRDECHAVLVGNVDNSECVFVETETDFFVGVSAIYVTKYTMSKNHNDDQLTSRTAYSMESGPCLNESIC